ncbi:Kinase [Hexamita inflata]|uniref:Kinase n=1 Tax=Hexamita inflata TaxID=28002 RepID=A0ABP1KPX0_9EUKA
MYSVDPFLTQEYKLFKTNKIEHTLNLNFDQVDGYAMYEKHQVFQLGDMLLFCLTNSKINWTNIQAQLLEFSKRYGPLITDLLYWMINPDCVLRYSLNEVLIHPALNNDFKGQISLLLVSNTIFKNWINEVYEDIDENFMGYGLNSMNQVVNQLQIIQPWLFQRYLHLSQLLKQERSQSARKPKSQGPTGQNQIIMLEDTKIQHFYVSSFAQNYSKQKIQLLKERCQVQRLDYVKQFVSRYLDIAKMFIQFNIDQKILFNQRLLGQREKSSYLSSTIYSDSQISSEYVNHNIQTKTLVENNSKLTKNKFELDMVFEMFDLDQEIVQQESSLQDSDSI